VVFFHGGGWVIGGLDSHDSVARGLCRDAAAVVVSVDYRLAPESPFPAAVEDAYAALCWVAGKAPELGADAGALTVAGDSAGGNLAAVVAHLARDRGGPRIARQILVYPATDARQKAGSFETNAAGYFLTAAHGRWFRDQYLGPDGDPAHPHVSPLLAEDLTELPPAHIVTAGCDPLCDEGRAYASALRGAGVRVTESHFPHMFHGFFGFPDLLGDARRAQADVAEVIVSSGRDGKNGGDTGGRAG
jgi:acetyl esterase